MQVKYGWKVLRRMAVLNRFGKWREALCFQNETSRLAKGVAGVCLWRAFGDLFVTPPFSLPEFGHEKAFLERQLQSTIYNDGA